MEEWTGAEAARQRVATRLTTLEGRLALDDPMWEEWDKADEMAGSAREAMRSFLAAQTSPASKCEMRKEPLVTVWVAMPSSADPPHSEWPMKRRAAATALSTPPLRATRTRSVLIRPHAVS